MWCSPWGHKELDMTERLKNNRLIVLPRVGRRFSCLECIDLNSEKEVFFPENAHTSYSTPATMLFYKKEKEITPVTALSMVLCPLKYILGHRHIYFLLHAHKLSCERTIRDDVTLNYGEIM